MIPSNCHFSTKHYWPKNNFPFIFPNSLTFSQFPLPFLPFPFPFLPFPLPFFHFLSHFPISPHISPISPPPLLITPELYLLRTASMSSSPLLWHNTWHSTRLLASCQTVPSWRRQGNGHLTGATRNKLVWLVCLYHVCLSVPCLFVYTMSVCLYTFSFSVPCLFVCTMFVCL